MPLPKPLRADRKAWTECWQAKTCPHLNSCSAHQRCLRKDPLDSGRKPAADPGYTGPL